MDPKIINYIKDHPKEAEALAGQWQEFIATNARENPEILDIRSREEFLAWATQHPEKHINTSIWVGKEITEYSYLKRQQEEKNKTTENEKQSQKKPFGEQRAEPYATKDFSAKQAFEKEQEERDREQRPSISARDINKIIKSAEQPQATMPRATYQPKAPTQAREFLRGSARLGGRFAGRTGSMAGRFVSRFAAQAGMMLGRAAVQGVVAGAAAIGAVGWIVIGVVVAIIIIVFLIIMFAGGGGAAPTVDCADADGNPIVVFDGNECAANLAGFYSNQTGTSITAACLDKCTDTTSLLCDRNATNNCTSPDASCGTMQTFCIQYSPAPLPSATWLYDCNSAIFDYTFFASCSGSGIITPTPTPVPTLPPGVTPTSTPTPTPGSSLASAFPGAEGFGAVSVGGRGGRVIEVTTLADGVPAPPGSLRACTEASGPRTCVFRVGGTIELISGTRFQITNPYLTIAGQTAPGGGILIRGHAGISIITHDVIIRYIRIRLNGTGLPNTDQVNIRIHTGAHNVIIDHCSTSWSFDESISPWKNNSLAPDITNLTVQRCVIAESLQRAHGMVIGGTDRAVNGDHLQVHEISVHHNLFVHNFDRNPRVSSAGTQLINNVVYNWGSRVGVSSRDNTVDFINNYWKPGPMSQSLIYKHESTNINTGWVYPDPSIYIVGNIVLGSFDNPTVDNWPLIVRDADAGWPPNTLLPTSYRRLTPLAQSSFPIAVQSAIAAYNSVLADAGANARLDCQGNWVPNSDAVDQRVIADANNGTGWSGQGPASPEATGGFPVIAAGTPCTDSDSDGMADEWETLHFSSLSQGSSSDSSSDFDSDGYTDLEEFLNGTNPSL